MSHPLLAAVAVTALAASAACSNAKLSADHSAAASVYGSAAVGESVATVVAVPLVVSGGALAISGAAIQEVGVGSMQAGSSVLQPQQTAPTTTTPNGAPTLN